MGMAGYRRWYRPGGTYFFTVVTERRRPLFADAGNRQRLRAAMREVFATLPTTVVAGVILPDHLHAIWTLPDDDDDFSTRWRNIKAAFTKRYLADGGIEADRSASRIARRNRGVWQRRFWEHLVRHSDDLNRDVEYIHFNPVKHGHALCPHRWEASSFGCWVERGDYPMDWCCICEGKSPALPDFGWATDDME